MVGINPKAVEGRKKPRSSFTPVVVLDEIDAGMTEGALKYGPYNWRDTQIEATDYYDSTMRHMRSWFNGEDIDPDSGVSHITKAITGLIVLRDAQLHGTCIDDRPYARSDEDASFSVHLRLDDGSSITNVSSHDVLWLVGRSSLSYNGLNFQQQSDDTYHEIVQNRLKRD